MKFLSKLRYCNPFLKVYIKIKIDSTGPSSCKPGTVLQGLNILKDGSDPVALPDEEYPPWLWTLLDTNKVEYSDSEKLSRKYLRMRNKDLIKSNAIKNKK